MRKVGLLVESGGGVSGKGHAPEQEGEGFVEGGGHGLEDFGGDVVRSRCLAIGKTAEAFHVAL